MSPISLSFTLLPSVLISLQWTLASLSSMYCQKLPLWVHSTPQGVSAGADSLKNIFDSETQSKPESLWWLNQLNIQKKIVGILCKLLGPILKSFLDTRILDLHLTEVDTVRARLHWCWESYLPLKWSRVFPLLSAMSGDHLALSC